MSTVVEYIRLACKINQVVTTLSNIGFCKHLKAITVVKDHEKGKEQQVNQICREQPLVGLRSTSRCPDAGQNDADEERCSENSGVSFQES
uniref:Uncharacterized protein n=1 Tax=Arundo donax TaxID=35708 RepID=A0A0A9D5F3_ARUDO